MIKVEHICTAIFIIILGGFLYLMYEGYQYEVNMTPAEKEVRAHHNSCISKIRGSRPACWDKKDWEAYCEYVECKRRP